MPCAGGLLPRRPVAAAMAEPGATHRWHRWRLGKRFGNDPGFEREHLQRLHRVRDAVLDGAPPSEGAVALDVGAGDGRIALAALERIGPSGQVTLAGVSGPLLDHSRELARQRGVSLDAGEAARHERHVRPLVEGGGGARREAFAFLAASKPGRAG